MKQHDPSFEGPAADVARALSRHPAELAANAEETPDCAGPTVLAALASGTLGEPERQAVLEHAGDCPRCLLGLDAAVEEVAFAKPSTGSPRRRPWGRLLLVAAAAAALILAGRLLLPSGAKSPETHRSGLPALARIEPLELRVTRGDETEGLIERARVLYVDGEFAACVALLEPAPPEPMGRLLLASALLLEGRASDALEAARGLELADERMAQEALWVTAQAHLRLADGDGARAALEALADGDGGRAAEARALLEELERLAGE